uniref:ATP synthase F0 subunit 8 n=1 Tax=Brachidontes exustus TaxID=40254 RepID=A0A0U1XA00_BRAEX|nr:ATP synthase F0 subunit 8 [Brachidontes exustus]AIM58702.1 ATP synthase F0 subunit 8 [Brachidontes exustus]
MFGSYFWFVLFMMFCLVFTVVEICLWWNKEEKVYFDF